MTSMKPDAGEFMKSCIPRTTLNIPMPIGAKPLPPTPSEPSERVTTDNK